MESAIFDVTTPIGIRVALDHGRWQVICGKHADMRGREDDVRQTLERPEEIRHSSHHPHVLLFYCRVGSPLYTCVVIHYEPEKPAFVNTCYRTHAIKAGYAAR
jgi:hypothetical protein